MPAAREREPAAEDRLRKQRQTGDAQAAAMEEEAAPVTAAGLLPGPGDVRVLQQTLGNAGVARLFAGSGAQSAVLQR